MRVSDRLFRGTKPAQKAAQPGRPARRRRSRRRRGFTPPSNKNLFTNRGTCPREAPRETPGPAPGIRHSGSVISICLINVAHGKHPQHCAPPALLSHVTSTAETAKLRAVALGRRRPALPGACRRAAARQRAAAANISCWRNQICSLNLWRFQAISQRRLKPHPRHGDVNVLYVSVVRCSTLAHRTLAQLRVLVDRGYSVYHHRGSSPSGDR